jgi:cbb3-type cytochrome oxidase maturation protein
MNMVFVLVLLSLSLAGVSLWAIFWAINKGQFDDLDSPAYSILDDEPKIEKNSLDENNDQKTKN